DVAGPYEVFNFLDGDLIGRTVNVTTVAMGARPLHVIGGLAVTPDCTFAGLAEVDLLFVPGAGKEGVVDSLGDDKPLQALRDAAGRSRYVASVCTGGLLLAAAGLLDGRQATTHWAAIEALKLFPHVIVVNGCPRYVHDGDRMTGGGISSS